jgi:hypothetical protein
LSIKILAKSEGGKKSLAAGRKVAKNSEEE